MDAQTLTRQLGGTWHGGAGQAPCPVCQPERRRDQNALSLKDGENGALLLYCFKSGCSFEELALTLSLPFKKAAINIEAQRQVKAPDTRTKEKNLGTARAMWQRAQPIEGSKAEAYLRARGITCPMPKTLRFVPDLYHAPSGKWCCAMLGNVEPTGGVHRTFFTKQGQRLASNAKMMLGPCAGGAVRLSGSAGPLVVCEGIETGLALLSGLLSGPHEVWAALSASGFSPLHLPPEPRKLIIATDSDDSGAGEMAGNALATRANALGWRVNLLPAPKGKDWADVLALKGAAA